MTATGVDAVFAGSPGLVAFLTGHVMPAHLGFPSRDARNEKPTLAIVTNDDAVTIGGSPTPAVGRTVSWGEGASGLRDDAAAFAAIGEALGSLRLRRGKMAVELAHVDAGAYRAVVQAAPELVIKPLNDLLAAAKAVKDNNELDGLRAALRLCDVGQAAVRAGVAPGVSELDLHGRALQAMNAETGDMIVSIGEIQVGARGELIAGPPTGAWLREGELAMCDLAPRHPNGWWGDSCLTVACGEPPQAARRDWRALIDGMEAGREVLRPGVTAGAVFEVVCRYAGMQPGHAGHGIGRDHYEEPVIAADSLDPLPENAVIVLEPGRYGDGRGMRVEHAFRVTPDGGERLSSFSLEM